jgi:hypothetical protein
VADKHIKDAYHHKSLWNYKLKQQCDTTVHLLGRLKSKTLTTSNAGQDVEKEELHSLLVGMKNDAATLEDSSAVSHKNHTYSSHMIRAILLK